MTNAREKSASSTSQRVHATWPIELRDKRLLYEKLNKRFDAKHAHYYTESRQSHFVSRQRGRIKGSFLLILGLLTFPTDTLL